MTLQLATPTATLGATHEQVTLLFSDVVGSTRLTLQLGDLAAHRLMERHNEIVREELRHWGGREIEVQGDGFLLAFPTASDGVGCAISIQRAMAEYRASNPEDLRVRIGVHSGAALPDGDRYFGGDVILCARICTAAQGDEILVSEPTARQARVDDRRLGTPRFESLKGFDEPRRVQPVAWSPAATRRAPVRTRGAPVAVAVAF